MMLSFTATLAFVAAFSGRLVCAQDPNFDSIDHPLKDEKVPAGQTYTVTWSLLSTSTPKGAVTLALIGGASPAVLESIGTIGHAQNGDLKFEWDVDPTLGAEAVYGITITLDSDTTHFQYSNPFQIVGGEASNSKSTASSAASSTASPTASASGSVTAVTSSLSSAVTSSTTFTISSTISSNFGSGIASSTSAIKSATLTANGTSVILGTTTAPTARPTITESSGASRYLPTALSALAVALLGVSVMDML